MRKLIFLIAICGVSRLSAQHIQVFSAKDSLRVSFASLLINGELINYSKTANDDGLIVVSPLFEDSAKYQITIQCFGFDKFTKKLYGYQIKNLKNIYLVPSNISLDEVVVTAQYEPTTAEKAVQKIKVIDKEKIQQMAAVNLRDVLTNQMNVRLQQDNILGSGMSLQGISGQNVKILIDGVPVIGRLDGNIDLSQINMNNVERIEFIEGPLSVQYGTDALGGTINIITKKNGSKRISAGLTSYYESIGTYNFSGDVSVGHKGHNLQLSGGRNYFDGWNRSDADFYFPKPRIADSARYKEWKPKEQYFGSLAYQYNFKKLNFGLKSSFFNEVITNRGYPYDPYGQSAFDDTYLTRRIDNNLSLNGSISKYWSVNALSAYNYYNRIKKTVFKDLTTLDEQLSADASAQDTSTYTLLMNRGSFVRNNSSSHVSYELGYDLNYESAFGKRIEDKIKYMGDYAGFATMEYKVSQMTIKPGIRYSYNTSYQTPLVPSLNVKWNVSDHHILRASYARGFRAPSLKELYFEFVDINHNIVGNPNLRSEQSDNYSLSYNYNRDIRKCKVKFDASVFYNNIFNLIDLQSTVGTVYSYINVGKFQSYGIQLGSSLNFKRLFLQGGFNYTARSNKLSSETDTPDFTYSPEVIMNATYKWLKPKVNFAVFYKYNGKLPGYAQGETGETVRTLINDYQIMDATVSKFFWRERVNLAIGCKNVLNVTNVRQVGPGSGAHSTTVTSLPTATGRNYFIKLVLNLSKS